MARTDRTAAWIVAALLATLWPGTGRALVDIPVWERGAISVEDLAASSGVARPADLAAGPLDDVLYREAYRALAGRGLVDPLGERLARWARLRSDGRLHWSSLRPDLTVRTYWANEDTTNRPLYHTAGDRLDHGWTTFVNASGAAFWGDRVAGVYEFQFARQPGAFSFRVKRLYLKGVWGKWSLKVGRDAERLGPGYHGGLLLDDNAPTYDYWRLRTEEPLFLPGRWASLGGFRFLVFNAYLSDDSPRPADGRYGSGVDPVHDPRLLVMRASYHPSPWLDLGVSRAILYGGKGREVYDRPADWWELFTATDENVKPGGSHRYDNDQYVALDLTVRLPFLNGWGPLKGGKVYWEYAATDIISKWQGEDTGNWEPFQLNRVANLGGLYLTTAVTDLRFEFAETDVPWYRNGQYPQGYTYRDRPLGHHMGGDARNWYLEVSRYLTPAWRATVSLDLEERAHSTATEERRAEWGLELEARRITLWGVPVELKAQGLWAKVANPLDDPAREARTEVVAGLQLTIRQN